MYSVGTAILPSGPRIAPRARYQVSAASIVAGSPSRATCRSIASGGTPLASSRSRSQREVVRKQARRGVGIEERLVMPRAVGLIAVRQRQRAVERVGVRARQHRQRGEALGITIGDAPGDAAAPVVADEMKAPAGVAAGGGDGHGVADELVEFVVRGVGGVGPRARRIAALARRDRAISGRGQRLDLRSPGVERFGKAVQQQHQRRALPRPPISASKVRPGPVVIVRGSVMADERRGGRLLLA